MSLGNNELTRPKLWFSMERKERWQFRRRWSMKKQSMETEI